MGYRSDVAFVLKNEDFLKLARQAEAECQEAFDLLCGAKIYQNKRHTTVVLEWVKWYVNYDDVSFVERFLKSYEVESIFKRIGEESGDIEEWENGDIDDYQYECVRICHFFDIECAGDKTDLKLIVAARPQPEMIMSPDGGDEVGDEYNADEDELLSFLSEC